MSPTEYTLQLPDHHVQAVTCRRLLLQQAIARSTSDGLTLPVYPRVCMCVLYDYHGSLDACHSNSGQWLTAAAIVTSDDIRMVRQFFKAGSSDGTEDQELLLDIVRIMRQLVGKNKRTDPENHKTIAMVVKVLTAGRTVEEAREYLRSNKDSEWCMSQSWIATTVLLTDIIVRQLVVSRVSMGAPKITDQTSSDDVIVIENNVSGRVSQPTIEVPPVAQSFVPEDAGKSSSDVSVGVSTEQCPECGQIHPNSLIMLLSVAEMLQKHGYNPELLGWPSATSGRQPSPLFSDPSQPQRLDSDAAAAMWLRLLAFSVFLLSLASSMDVFLRLLSK
ncbi:hypothetical protein yc1106_05122 [Curvularia clavata]|uniref:Uncharacterized protein n=1 Tax=Curvularia clavata TaxID=95742 RepID=A0A9Q8ZBQ1_CURCL|nr:hypothetical protein yc1106_05122 [Curvularia clavata]